VSSRIFCNPFSFSRVVNCGFFWGARVCCLRLSSSLKENFGWVFSVTLRITVLFVAIIYLFLGWFLSVCCRWEETETAAAGVSGIREERG
jgi:hypothetical protein